MDDGDDLSILREEAAIGHVDELQHLRVVVHLDRHGIHVLRAGDQQVDGKRLVLFGLDRRRIEQEIRCAGGLRLLRWRIRARTGLIWLSLIRAGRADGSDG